MINTTSSIIATAVNIHKIILLVAVLDVLSSQRKIK
jgi:hypothetical protein